MLLKFGFVFMFLINNNAISATEEQPLTLRELFNVNGIANWTWPNIHKLIQKTVDNAVGNNFRFINQLRSQLNISGQCHQALFTAVMDLRQDKSWIIKMIDASAKIPSGILEGTVIDMGSFDECLAIHVNDSNDDKFQGKYCMVRLRSPLISTPQGKTYEKLYGKPPPWIADQMQRAGGFMKEVGFYFGLCIPSWCTDHDLRNLVQMATGVLGFEASIVDCQINKTHTLNVSEIGAISSLSSLLAVVIAGTIVDIITRALKKRHGRTWINMKADMHTKENWLLRILKAFSIIRNTEQLLNGANAAGSTLSFLHGIRFFSATWIILGHTYFFVDTWMYLKYRHLLRQTEYFNYDFPVAVIENFTIPVGSFFFISGFLMTFTNYTKLEKSGGKLNLLIFFFHKYWRMTPALGLTISILLAMPLIGSGPLWYTTFDPEIKNCISNWWKNILYVSNWWNTDNICLLHTWYLSALMQFHILGILLMLLLFQWPVVAVVISILLLATCCIFTALQVVWNNFPMPALGIIRDLDVIKKYNSDIYIKPYAHIASYLIGMLSGFFVIKYRHVRLSFIQKAFGWTIATIFALASVYGIYGPSKLLAVRAAYVSLHRISWALAMAWLTFSCASKSAGPVNNILTWGAFQPLGQLSYLAYLLHPLVILFRNGSLHERVYYSHIELVFAFLSNVVVSFFLAYLCYIAVELPFSAVEAIILKSGQSKKKSTNVTVSNGFPRISTINIKCPNVQPVSIRSHYTPDSPKFSSPNA